MHFLLQQDDAHGGSGFHGPSNRLTHQQLHIRSHVHTIHVRFVVDIDCNCIDVPEICCGRKCYWRFGKQWQHTGKFVGHCSIVHASHYIFSICFQTKIAALFEVRHVYEVFCVLFRKRNNFDRAIVWLIIFSLGSQIFVLGKECWTFRLLN